ncbi:N-acetylmuramoyl-L-alanine amidase [Candidatus Anstonella stagnisolia]|nr:N-acetylmuramoyl-L-alanine amidase [Candidatus Anstonella stagnisolia]
MQNGKKLVVLNPAHGGNNSGIVHGEHRECAIARSVILKLQDKLLAEGKVEATTSFELAGKPLCCAWEHEERRGELKSINSTSNAIDFLLSIGVSYDGPKQESSGLVIHHGTGLMAPIVMRDTLIAHARESGYSLEGNRHYSQWFYSLDSYTATHRINHCVLNTVSSELIVLPGFLSNPADREILTSKQGQDVLAEGIAQGLYRILSV